jgi:hypothetical protein
MNKKTKSTSHKTLINFEGEKSNCTVEKLGRHHPDQVTGVNIITNGTD